MSNNLVINYREESQDGQAVTAFTRPASGVRQYHVSLQDVAGPLNNLRKTPSSDFGGGNLFVEEKDVEQFHRFLERKFAMSNAHKVREFTSRGGVKQLPNKPRPMTKQEVVFIIKMVMSELTELAQTVTDNADEAVALVRNCAGTDVKPQYQKPSDVTKLIADQNDAMVDAWYYMLDAAAKCGVNLSELFHVVHKANMDKRGPDGKFIIRESDGKVLKPDNWREPDITGEISRQLSEGAF